MGDPPATDVPTLTEAYQDARKAYGLVSALLIALELIGIDFEATPIESINVTLKSPQAVPYVLVVLVLYFALRFTIEWKQSHPGRRSLPASRVDFAMAHCIGMSSLALYGVQTILRIQIADTIPPSRFIAILGGFAVGQMSVIAISRLLFRHHRRDKTSRLMAIVAVICAIASLFLVIQMPSLLGYALVAASLGVLLSGLFELWLWRIWTRTRTADRLTG